MSADVANRPDLDPPPLIVRAAPALRATIWALGLALILTLAGAFDTGDLGFPRRLALWSIISVLIVGQAALLDTALAAVFPFGAVPRIAAAICAVIATWPLSTAEIFLLKRTPLPPPWWGDDPFGALLVSTAPPILAIAALVLVLRAPAVRRAAGGPALSRRAESLCLAAPARMRPVIAGLLPPPSALRDWPEGRVLAVRARDHYLEVDTAERRWFIRGRMDDAAARLAGADGMRVHRSWWVARQAVAGVRRTGRDIVLILADRREAPVSRSRVARLRAKGWL